MIFVDNLVMMIMNDMGSGSFNNIYINTHTSEVLSLSNFIFNVNQIVVSVSTHTNPKPSYYVDNDNFNDNGTGR